MVCKKMVKLNITPSQEDCDLLEKFIDNDHLKFIQLSDLIGRALTRQCDILLIDEQYEKVLIYAYIDNVRRPFHYRMIANWYQSAYDRYGLKIGIYLPKNLRQISAAVNFKARPYNDGEPTPLGEFDDPTTLGYQIDKNKATIKQWHHEQPPHEQPPHEQQAQSDLVIEASVSDTWTEDEPFVPLFEEDDETCEARYVNVVRAKIAGYLIDTKYPCLRTQKGAKGIAITAIMNQGLGSCAWFALEFGCGLLEGRLVENEGGLNLKAEFFDWIYEVCLSHYFTGLKRNPLTQNHTLLNELGLFIRYAFRVSQHNDELSEGIQYENYPTVTSQFAAIVSIGLFRSSPFLPKTKVFELNNTIKEHLGKLTSGYQTPTEKADAIANIFTQLPESLDLDTMVAEGFTPNLRDAGRLVRRRISDDVHQSVSSMSSFNYIFHSDKNIFIDRIARVANNNVSETLRFWERMGDQVDWDGLYNNNRDPSALDLIMTYDDFWAYFNGKRTYRRTEYGTNGQVGKTDVDVSITTLENVFQKLLAKINSGTVPENQTKPTNVELFQVSKWSKLKPFNGLLTFVTTSYFWCLQLIINIYAQEIELPPSVVTYAYLCSKLGNLLTNNENLFNFGITDIHDGAQAKAVFDLTRQTFNIGLVLNTYLRPKVKDFFKSLSSTCTGNAGPTGVSRQPTLKEAFAGYRQDSYYGVYKNFISEHINLLILKLTRHDKNCLIEIGRETAKLFGFERVSRLDECDYELIERERPLNRVGIENGRTLNCAYFRAMDDLPTHGFSQKDEQFFDTITFQLIEDLSDPESEYGINTEDLSASKPPEFAKHLRKALQEFGRRSSMAYCANFTPVLAFFLKLKPQFRHLTVATFGYSNHLTPITCSNDSDEIESLVNEHFYRKQRSDEPNTRPVLTLLFMPGHMEYLVPPRMFDSSIIKAVARSIKIAYFETPEDCAPFQEIFYCLACEVPSVELSTRDPNNMRLDQGYSYLNNRPRVGGNLYDLANEIESEMKTTYNEIYSLLYNASNPRYMSPKGFDLANNFTRKPQPLNIGEWISNARNRPEVDMVEKSRQQSAMYLRNSLARSKVSSKSSKRKPSKTLTDEDLAFYSICIAISVGAITFILVQTT